MYDESAGEDNDGERRAPKRKAPLPKNKKAKRVSSSNAFPWTPLTYSKVSEVINVEEDPVRLELWAKQGGKGNRGLVRHFADEDILRQLDLPYQGPTLKQSIGSLRNALLVFAQTNPVPESVRSLIKRSSWGKGLDLD